MRLLAIDPSTNKVGVAFFDFGKLVDARTITTTATERRFRQFDLVSQILQYYQNNIVEHIAIEDPYLQGQGNKVMQRMIGALEIALTSPFVYYAPNSIKKAMGSGKLSKLEMALQAGEMLASDEEQNILAEKINNEEWDATDAVCIGLTFLRGGSRANS